MYWLNPLAGIAAFVGMEVMAWVTHKYLMHGVMWFFHKDHHQTEPGFFERNDVFFFIFAIPSWLCIMLGLLYKVDIAVWIGGGIAAYGLCYFLIHDVFIHRRFSWLKTADLPYFVAIRKAHKVHHKQLNKEDAECFGMLWVPSKYFREAKQAHRLKRINK